MSGVLRQYLSTLVQHLYHALVIHPPKYWSNVDEVSACLYKIMPLLSTDSKKLNYHSQQQNLIKLVSREIEKSVLLQFLWEQIFWYLCCLIWNVFWVVLSCKITLNHVKQSLYQTPPYITSELLYVISRYHSTEGHG